MKSEKKFIRELRRLGVEKHDRCLVALSGGGDSMALLDLLHRASQSTPLFVCAARVFHGIRSAGDEDSENRLCEAECRKRSIEFRVLKSEKGIAVEKASRRGVEQAARTYRQTLLDSHADELDARWIFYGHNADDRLETIFMRMLTGAGPEGLAGIPEVHGRICRPLLSFSRQELRNHLETHGIPWAEDITNSGNAYLRNRFRNELIPLVADIFPGWTSALDTLGERSAEAADALEKSLARELPEVGELPDYPGGTGWRRDDWGAASGYSRALALWGAFNRMDRSGIPDRRFSWRSLRGARNAADRGHDWKSGDITLLHRNGFIVALPGQADGKYPGIPGAPGESGGFRIVLKKDEVNPDFLAELGGFSFHITRNAASRKKNRPYFPVDVRWPMVLESPGSGGEPAVHSLPESHDADGDLVYISMVAEEEGIDGR